MNARSATLAFLLILGGFWPTLVGAQDATPTIASENPPDLAAMALSPEDVPAGFFDDYGEWWVPSAPFGELVLGEAAPSGLEQVYQSFYFDPDQPAGIHSYLFLFASPRDAEAGLDMVEAVLRPPLPEGTVVGPTQAPGPDLGDGPSELTAVTYDTWEAGGPRVDVVAATFRRDRLVAGVSVERFTDPPSAGTPLADPASPVAFDPAQEEMATRLATTVDERISVVLAGESPLGVDRTLSELMLPLDQLVEGPTPVLGGYKSGVDLLRCGVCGEENSLLPFAEDALGGFSRTVSVGPLVDGEPQPPFVSIAISTFTSPEVVQEVLEAIRQTPNDRPTSGPVPRGDRTPVEDPEIPGADGALAFHAALDAENPDAAVDSAGVTFVLGDQLVTVDVQGGLSAEAALAAAVDLATQQAACLDSGDRCDSVTVPPSLAEGASG